MFKPVWANIVDASVLVEIGRTSSRAGFTCGNVIVTGCMPYESAGSGRGFGSVCVIWCPECIGVSVTVISNAFEKLSGVSRASKGPVANESTIAVKTTLARDGALAKLKKVIDMQASSCRIGTV